MVTSELTRVEFAGAVTAAYRGRRVDGPDVLLARFDADCGEEGSLTQQAAAAAAHGLPVA